LSPLFAQTVRGTCKEVMATTVNIGVFRSSGRERRLANATLSLGTVYSFAKSVKPFSVPFSLDEPDLPVTAAVASGDVTMTNAPVFLQVQSR
jgi:hypothetical protein